MKACMRNQLFRFVLVVRGLALAAHLPAQTFSLVVSNLGHSQAGVVFSDGALYGTTSGTVFKVQTNGTGHTVLHVFPQDANMRAGLVLSGNTLYGITRWGIGHTNGVIFSLNVMLNGDPPFAGAR